MYNLVKIQSGGKRRVHECVMSDSEILPCLERDMTLHAKEQWFHFKSCVALNVNSVHIISLYIQ